MKSRLCHSLGLKYLHCSPPSRPENKIWSSSPCIKNLHSFTPVWIFELLSGSLTLYLYVTLKPLRVTCRTPYCTICTLYRYMWFRQQVPSTFLGPREYRCGAFAHGPLEGPSQASFNILCTHHLLCRVFSDRSRQRQPGHFPGHTYTALAYWAYCDCALW